MNRPAAPFRYHYLSALFLLAIAASAALSAAETPPPAGRTVPLFDGTTLAGWEGNPKLWRVADGCLTGGSLTETVKENDFLATTRDFTNFIVRLQIKLTGSNGFINSGFQIRSQRVPNSSEMAGYQCDFGEPNWYGAIYDESRRNKVMSASDMKALRPVLQPNGWNDYVIRADGARITTWLNGVLGTDYTEADPAITDGGKLGIQIHGGGKALVQVKDISIEELPGTPPGRKFLGAPEPKKSAQAVPLSADEERAAFTLPPGFEMELVAQESEGIGKFVAVDWDLEGRLWSMTALEYPVDANESPAVARELYASRAKDKVVVWDRDEATPTGYSAAPRIFAAGLAIPLGILPYKNGVYVQHGTEIAFLSDSNGDGEADRREVILSGFGVQDSHLFPHQFTRGPGHWLWMAQGAFNYGKVKTSTGKEQQFDQTRMAKFRADGSDFEITSQGPCNIWGLVLTAEGESWIQEANDYGYPVMPFHEYANYPGCSDAQFKSYAPEFPGTAPDFKMGGTGLSGLALTDAYRGVPGQESDPARAGAATNGCWPEAYCDVMYVANPITRKIQAIKILRDGPRFRYQKLPDFVQSSDEMFRPVALRLGPDGCLYVVDWYNKIISHNEVPRNHPERDKKRGRIWRVKHREAKPLEVPEFMKLSGNQLLARLGGENTPQSHLAWQAITDRQLQALAPKLKTMLLLTASTPAACVQALWALEGLREADPETVTRLLSHTNRNVRREAVRALADNGLPSASVIAALTPLAEDGDPVVRAEIIRSAGKVLAGASRFPSAAAASVNAAVALLVRMAQAPLAEPVAKSTHNGRLIKVGVAYEREFERYLARMFLERAPEATASFLDSEAAGSHPLENRLIAALALEPKSSAGRVAQLLPQLARAPGQEEVLRLAQFPDQPGVGDALKKILQQPATSTAVLEGLLRVRTRLDAAKITPLLVEAAEQLLASSETNRVELGAKLAGSFQLTRVEPGLIRVLKTALDSRPTQAAGTPLVLSSLRALREIKSAEIELIATALQGSENPAVQNEAAATLAASRDPRGPEKLAGLYPTLPAMARRTALTSLAGTKPGASATVHHVRAGNIPRDELDGPTLDKLQAVLGPDPDLALLMQEMASFFRPALRLDGNDNAWSETEITLQGAFTVETWVKLDPGIDNNDGLLGVPGLLDMNFYGGQFRVWVGSGGIHDAIVARKKMVADVWTHIAVTRDEAGNFRLYQNGELDTAESKPVQETFAKCRLAWTAPARGTAGWLSEFRIWNHARSADQVRAAFDRSYEKPGTVSPSTSTTAGGAGDQMQPDLLFNGTNWGRLHGGAKVVKTADFPPLLSAEEAKAVASKFSHFHALAGKDGDLARGRTLFASACQQCHSVGGQGGQVGPVLNGAGALGVEALLRNILTPNAAMEPGYRLFRVELKDGDIVDGILVTQDPEAIVLRRANAEDLRIPQQEVRRARYTKMSVMPEGLLDAMKPEEVADLFAYLKTLK